MNGLQANALQGSAPAGIELQRPGLSGALLVDKPVGLTSFDVVRRLKPRLPRGTKIGHGGTLDPFATGLLVLLVGRSTRLASNFLGSDKAYEGVFRFGVRTQTADSTGAVVEENAARPESLMALQKAAQAFAQKPYEQIPPMFSAKKHQGKPLYKLARKGVEVERVAKVCKLWDFEILEFDGTDARFKIKCSSGTYVRTLAEDFARSLGCIATLQSLRRTACGGGVWNIDRTLPLDSILTTQGPLDESNAWVPYYLLINSGAIRGPEGVGHSKITV